MKGRAAGVHALPDQSHHRVINTLRGVRDAQLGHALLHPRLRLGAAEDVRRRVVQRRAIGLALQQDPGPAVGLQQPCVLLLMVVGDVGEGTMMAGIPSAVSSLMVDAPARQMTRSAARITVAML